MPSLGLGQNAPRFLWVPRADGFLFPFAGVKEMIKMLPERIDVDSLPSSLHEYMVKIRELLEQWKEAGAVAVKFAIAYRRPLDFAQVSDEEANRVFARQRDAERHRRLR